MWVLQRQRSGRLGYDVARACSRHTHNTPPHIHDPRSKVGKGGEDRIGARYEPSLFDIVASGVDGCQMAEFLLSGRLVVPGGEALSVTVLPCRESNAQTARVRGNTPEEFSDSERVKGIAQVAGTSCPAMLWINGPWFRVPFRFCCHTKWWQSVRPKVSGAFATEDRKAAVLSCCPWRNHWWCSSRQRVVGYAKELTRGAGSSRGRSLS